MKPGRARVCHARRVEPRLGFRDRSEAQTKSSSRGLSRISDPSMSRPLPGAVQPRGIVSDAPTRHPEVTRARTRRRFSREMSAALVDASDGASDADSPRGSSTLSDDDVGSPSRHPRALSFPRAGADAVEALEAVEEAQRASTSSPVTADQDVEELLLLFAHERETTLERLRAARAVVHEVSTSMSEWQRRARRHLRDRRLRRIRRAAFDAWRARAACDPVGVTSSASARACGCARDSVASSADGATSRDEPAATRPPSVAPSRVATTSRAHARSARGAALARVDHHHARLDLLLSHLRRRVQRRVVRDACRRWRDHLRRARDDARRDVAADASLRRAARRRLHRAMLTWHAATRRAARVKAAASRALASAEAAEAAEGARRAPNPRWRMRRRRRVGGTRDASSPRRGVRGDASRRGVGGSNRARGVRGARLRARGGGVGGVSRRPASSADAARTRARRRAPPRHPRSAPPRHPLRPSRRFARRRVVARRPARRCARAWRR